MKANKQTVENWLSEMSETLVSGSLDLMREVKPPKTPAKENLNKTLTISYLQEYVKRLVEIALTDYQNHNLDQKGKYDHTRVEFDQLKADIQHAVCEGFETAVKKCYNYDIGYYCIINPMPEPINKHLC